MKMESAKFVFAKCQRFLKIFACETNPLYSRTHFRRTVHSQAAPTTCTAGVTIGAENTTIEVDEDAGSLEICLRIFDGELDRPVTVTGFTREGTATGKESKGL